MRVVVALGGNALLRRGEPLSAERQRRNIDAAADALAPIALEHELVITHGNGPQVGLLALQGAAYADVPPYPLDVLGAETEGMIGYMIEQALDNLLPVDRRVATLLTQIEVDVLDSAFREPSKPIGPVYSEEQARRLADERGWTVAPDGDQFRRVVPSPRPKCILELGVIQLLVEQGVVVICAGGGGIPVLRRKDGSVTGIEAVIDKDRASALIAKELNADMLIMLTDVEAVFTDWRTSEARAIGHAPPAALRELDFAAGSMGPKVEAACEFVERTGGTAGIGALADAIGVLAGKIGTIVDAQCAEMERLPVFIGGGRDNG